MELLELVGLLLRLIALPFVLWWDLLVYIWQENHWFIALMLTGLVNWPISMMVSAAVDRMEGTHGQA